MARIRFVTWVGIDGSYSRPSDTFETVLAAPSTRCGASLRGQYCYRSPWRDRPAATSSYDDLFTEMHRYKSLGLMWSGQNRPHGAHPNEVMSHGKSAAFRLGTVELNLVRP